MQGWHRAAVLVEIDFVASYGLPPLAAKAPIKQHSTDSFASEASFVSFRCLLTSFSLSLTTKQ